ncbi:PREDICTED: mucin-6 [Propithecus coquereli]|uniref:mucin-6 n=1 Tax=Propithecus coquereli TaxID=379532 RepID=UPI00063F6B4C|nr:PREDICTED: mucin-6 [Propithecus coquereli]
MLAPGLLLLLCCGGALLGAGLDDASSASPGPWRLEDSPQIDPDRGWCSTWGASHFSTFDHHVYDFSGTCNYVFAATCKDASPTFSVQLRRGPDGNVSRIIVELGASVVTVSEAAISVKDVGAVSLPHTSNGLQIAPFGQSVRLVAKQLELELEVVWGPDAHLMVLVERKHGGQLCGLCGDFNGNATDEFLSEEGKLLEPHEYAALQRMDDPGEICTYEAVPRPPVPQAELAGICSQLLALVSPECDVPKEPFVRTCQADMAAAAQNGSCATLSEYSRRCSMAGQPVSRWRGPGLCSLGPCPANQVYQECGAACARTCSNPQHHCSGFCAFGCFCPEGTVLNDLSQNDTCVPVAQCPCLLNGALYAPGEVTTTACRTCRCTSGRWTCTERPCPGHCSLEGGSFVTTFDARPYRFHGTCTYILLQSPRLPDEGTLLAVYDKSGYSHSETSLVAVIYLTGQDKIVISQDELITNNGDAKWLPYKTRNITVFRQTSTHLQVATTFGLELVVQLQPIFQVYVTVGPQFRGQTRGLCGNFNGDTTDDFMASVGIAEGTASLFVDSWRAGNCPAALERETDPCSMSQLNKVCAETHCSVLLRKGTVFERCHAVVNPTPFYKRCVYQACNYEETFPHICAALGSYAHACSSRGVLLWGWRSSVDNCTVPCSGNRTFSYDSRACGHTCLSLSDRAAECHPSAVPVDGCNCPEGTYLDHRGECVRRAQCPCLESGKLVLAEQSTVVNGAVCLCINGRLSCPGRSQLFSAACSAPKTFESCGQSSENEFGAACAPTCQMLATGVACVPTKCEPGCVCAEGLYENADGQCVPPEECPCEFAGVSYPGGAELHADCRTCTCSRGKWTCQDSAHCPSTCALYGEGHVVTFDGQRFVFDGNCEYILSTDGCGANASQPTFKILTENVICGRSGVTCSRAIKIFLGGLSIVLADSNYTVTGDNPHVHLRVQPDALHLVLDIGVPGRYNLTLVWNKHMTVFIKLHRASQDALCGLCGNYNGNMKDDFETRSQYVASSELEFVNSWKESPLCGDVSFLVEPCSLNAFRRSWAERKCSLINSQTFAACHSKVYHMPYYEACVRDTCACDTGGDCECLCDAVAAYAKACLDKGVCVDWRTPTFCPIYCDYYNTHTQVGSSGEYQYTPKANCTWHYQPCLCPGRPDSLSVTNIEGCYNCSQDEYFDHEEGACLPCAPPTTPQPPTATQPPTTGDRMHTRISYNHHGCHHTHHTSASQHSQKTHSDSGHKPSHSILSKSSHAVHRSAHSPDDSDTKNCVNVRDQLKSGHPSPTQVPTSTLTTTSFTPHGSTSAPASSSSPVIPPPSTSGPGSSKLETPVLTGRSPGPGRGTGNQGACSVQEHQEEITFKGCTANVTMTRCEGVCASSASFNIDTQEVDVHCGCCHPLSSYTRQLELPCPDPSAPSERLVLTLQVFSSCGCSPQGCRD